MDLAVSHGLPIEPVAPQSGPWRSGLRCPVRIHANQTDVSKLVATFREDGATADGWVTVFVDPFTGQRWRRIHLWAERQGGGMPVLISEPVPSVAELLDLVAESSDSAEIAASAWLMSEVDPEGAYKEPLLALAERAASQDDHARAELLVGWGQLDSEMNLRSALGKPAAQVTSDHDHFKRIAARARQLLRLGNTAPLLRDPAVFGLNL